MNNQRYSSVVTAVVVEQEQFAIKRDNGTYFSVGRADWAHSDMLDVFKNQIGIARGLPVYDKERDEFIAPDPRGQGFLRFRRTDK